MTTEEKRRAIWEHCMEIPKNCIKCACNEHEFCKEYNSFNAPDEIIDEWYSALFPELTPIINIKDSGDRTEFTTGAVRDMHEGKGRMDLLPWSAIIEVSKHAENGSKKYGEHNVDKGIPTHSFLDSAFRHLAKFNEGWTDEPHLVAAAWNILWAIQTEIKHPELKDVPWNG